MLDVGKSMKNPEVGDGGPCISKERIEELEHRVDLLDEFFSSLAWEYKENRDWWNTRLEDMRDRFFVNLVQLEDSIKLERAKDESFRSIVERMKT